MNLKHSSFLRMDEKVIFTMAGTCIIAVIVFAFRLGTSKSCESININFTSDSIFVNETVRLSADTKNAATYVWDFGDGTPATETTASVSHNYKEAKTYTVKVMADEICTDIKTLVVYEHQVEKVTPTGPYITYPSTAFVNETVSFADISSNAKSWEWYFEDNPEVHSREKNTTYTFKTSGTKKFILRINNKDQVANFIEIRPKPIVETPIETGAGAGGRRRVVPTIVINSAPESKQNATSDQNSTANNNIEPAKTEVPKQKIGAEISQAQLEKALYEVSQGIKSANDFSAYLCDNLNIPVTYEDKQIPFSEFCGLLKSIKAKKIKQIPILVIHKNSNNCITSMTVSIKKKFLGIL